MYILPQPAVTQVEDKHPARLSTGHHYGMLWVISMYPADFQREEA
jgi:hypothetical protein